MPTQQGVWLNYMEGLFPELREMGKKNEAKTVRIGNLRSLDLSIQDDQLLAQQRIFYNQIDTAAG